jgi:putative nucleotidyltransferase with HDIG domain
MCRQEGKGVKRQIRLRGINGDMEGLTWEGETILRAGRLATGEIVLDDCSVSRRHAEIKFTPQGWRVRDLGSTNGTFVNGDRVGVVEHPIKAHDILRCGNVTLVVEALRDGNSDEIPAAPDNMQVEAFATASFEEAIKNLVLDVNSSPRPGQQLEALMRAGHYLGHMESEDELLHAILNDAVSTLDAQRGAIVLAEGPTATLRLRALATGQRQMGSRHGFSQNLAQRSFQRGESVLCNVAEDPELACAKSIAEGTMASVLCVLLRTPRKRLGVLHLDRGQMQKPFTKEDLRLADALAASVSAGIESAQLLQKQRELFLSTITILANAVELRDPYTGGHTIRVTQYSQLLADHLDLPPAKRELIKIGCPLHDIGKIGISDEILNAPRKLTLAEFEIMKSHTTKGAKILEQVPDLPPEVIEIVRSRHERWDGLGYPDALEGTGIPELARIVAVADAFDAMTSDRPYRAGMEAETAFLEVEKQKGRQFDPDVATAFLAIRQRVVQEMHSVTKTLGLRAASRRIAVGSGPCTPSIGNGGQ